MRDNQRGDFGTPYVSLWMTLFIILAVSVIPVVVDIYENGVDEWWASFTTPISAEDAWNIVWSEFLHAMTIILYFVGGFVALLIVCLIGFWALNYFWVERKEPSLKCRILGHHGVERDNHIVCPMCGKYYGEYKTWDVVDKETGEIKHYGGFDISKNKCDSVDVRG